MASILVVDDEPSAEGTADLLALTGWKAEAARSGAEALERLRASAFDAVVLDRNMPGMRGDEVLRQIHASPALRHLCVVMLTGYGDVPNAVDSLKLGAWQYLQKPASIEDIRSVLMGGIAVKRCDKIRAELLSAFNREEMLRKVREIATDTMEADGLHIVFVDKAGNPVDILGHTPPEPPRRRFWKEIMQGQPFLWTETEAETRPLEPLLNNAKCLMAVPVRGENGKVIGVLDVESIHERFFAPGWKDTIEYIADLISLFLALEDAQREKREHLLAEARIVQLGQLHRELRHSIGTFVQTMSQAVHSMEANSQTLDEDARRRLSIIRRNADSCRNVVIRLREAAEDLNITWTSVDLAEVVRRVSGDFADECDGGNGRPLIRASGMDAAVTISGDVDLLTHAIQCMVRNAIEAIQDRRNQDISLGKNWTGTIDIGLTDTGADVGITVRDNGIGLDPKLKDKIFEPLFTTKSALRKTAKRAWTTEANAEPENQGMGLFTVWRVVGAHGGSIEVHSEGLLKGWTTFTVRLPKPL